MSENPFEIIDERLTNIESLLERMSNQPKLEIRESQEKRLTRTELSNKYKISLGTIHNLMKSGRLQFEKVGSRTLFKVDDVENCFKGGRND